VYLARAHQLIAWSGWVGLALISTAIIVVVSQWPSSPGATGVATLAPARQPARLRVDDGPGRAVVRLGKRADVPLLLTQIERAALDNGLTWPAGEYRITPATDREPAALEVRCSLKAPYPKLRLMFARLLEMVPTITFKEFKLSRTSVENADVEAELVIAVLLDDDASDPGKQPTARRR
jgi:hypothetical protein